MGLEFGIDLRCCIESKSLQLLCLDSEYSNSDAGIVNCSLLGRESVSVLRHLIIAKVWLAAGNCANKGSLRKRTSVIICLFNVLVLRQGCTL